MKANAFHAVKEVTPPVLTKTQRRNRGLPAAMQFLGPVRAGNCHARPSQHDLFRPLSPGWLDMGKGTIRAGMRVDICCTSLNGTLRGTWATTKRSAAAPRRFCKARITNHAGCWRWRQYAVIREPGVSDATLLSKFLALKIADNAASGGSRGRWSRVANKSSQGRQALM